MDVGGAPSQAFARALAQVQRELALGASVQKGSAYELEVRLGSTNPDTGGFVAEVDYLWFSTLQRRLDACKDWLRKTHWIETEDIFFEDNAGRTIRQSRLCDADTCEMTLRTIHKQRLSSSNVSLSTLVAATNEILPSGVDTLRFAHARESPVEVDTLPQVVNPTHTCIKQRKQFVLASASHPGAFWNIDLTRRWSGRTREEAEQQQHSANPVCEVEIEFEGAGCPADIDTASVLASMYTKAVSFLQ